VGIEINIFTKENKLSKNKTTSELKDYQQWKWNRHPNMSLLLSICIIFL